MVNVWAPIKFDSLIKIGLISGVSGVKNIRRNEVKVPRGLCFSNHSVQLLSTVSDVFFSRLRNHEKAGRTAPKERKEGKRPKT